MKIRPKSTGVKFTSGNEKGKNWRQQVFNHYRQHILDTLQEYGDADDYGQWLNDMQSRHAILYKQAQDSGDWEKYAYQNNLVGEYQHDYKGDQRFGKYNPNQNYTTDFNQLGISKAQESNRYDISGPRRISGDYGNYDYKVDNLYSAITDDRRLLGRLGDWNENSQEYKDFINELNKRGWTMQLDPSDNYYKLHRLPNFNNDNPTLNNNNSITPNETIQISKIPERTKKGYGFDWNKLSQNLQKSLPGLLGLGRLAGNLINNDRVYDESLKAIRPDLLQTYKTHRQIVGDEATKQAFYRRAAEGQTKASRPFTSDADRQMAYQMEAKRIGDELREKGDLADNAEIRRTSDESNQHQWANIARATETANYNNKSINYANALRHNLLAQKHSAQWTSIDNYLQGLEYRARQAQQQDKALSDQIWALQENENISNDKEIQEAYQKVVSAQQASKVNGVINNRDPKVIEAKKNYDSIINKKQRESLERTRSRIIFNPLFAKKGTSLTLKQKDDLLYKSTRDAVEHFRKMSKIASDSYNRKRIKIDKLVSVPKATKKMQQGGVAPFTVYKPIALGGETSFSQSSSNTTGSAKSSEEGKNTLDFVKEMFKTLNSGKGLPNDVNYIYKSIQNLLAQSSLFGNELSTEDIASLYLQSMEQLNNAIYSKQVFDQAKTIATNKGSLGEYAVTADGRYVTQNQEGKLQLATLQDIESKQLNPITNDQLLNLRAYDPSMILGIGDQYMQIINNSTSMEKIGDTIKSLLPNLGSSETIIEGYTKVDSNKIRAGVKELMEAPEGDYKRTITNKNSLEQINLAFKYIKGMLPKNMKAILDINAFQQRISSNDLIASLISSGASSTYKVEYDAVTGKAAKDANGNSKTGSSSEGLKLDAPVALIKGAGYKKVMEFNPGTSYAVTVNGIHTEFQKHSGENLGQTTMDEVLQSTLKGVLDFDKATLGESRLNPMSYNHVVINNGNVIAVDLPVGNDKFVPDFSLLKKLEQLDEELLKKGIDDNPNNWQQINLICQTLGIPDKYTSDGKLNVQKWNRFAAFQVTTDDSIFQDKKALLSEIISKADSKTRQLYEQLLQSKQATKDFDLGDGFFGIGKQELYQGTVFVPIKSSYVGAAISGGQNLTMQQTTDLELKELGYNTAKVASYKPAPNINL